MKEKTTIEDLFAQYQPDLGDRNEYLENLSKKLEAVEYLKQYRESQTRRYLRMMVAVFISGFVTGATRMSSPNRYWFTAPYAASSSGQS